MMKVMNVRPRRSRWLALIAFAIVVVVVLAAVPASRHEMLRAAGRALVVDDPIEPVDAIALPQWAGTAGALDAADLVRAGIARRVLLLPEPLKPAEQELARRGVPYLNGNAALEKLLHDLGVADVDVNADPAAGTEDEGRALLSWCDERRIRSLIVVSGADHSRRVRRVLRRAAGNASTKVIVRSARYSPFDPDRWWTTRDGIRTGIVEFEKLLLDVARHPIG